MAFLCLLFSPSSSWLTFALPNFRSSTSFIGSGTGATTTGLVPFSAEGLCLYCSVFPASFLCRVDGLGATTSGLEGFEYFGGETGFSFWGAGFTVLSSAFS